MVKLNTNTNRKEILLDESLWEKWNLQKKEHFVPKSVKGQTEHAGLEGTLQ